jgi:hypothetical protein
MEKSKEAKHHHTKQEHYTGHRHNYIRQHKIKESEESKMKRKRLNAKKKRMLLDRLFFTLFSIIAILIVLFCIWLYTQ